MAVIYSLLLYLKSIVGARPWGGLFRATRRRVTHFV